MDSSKSKASKGKGLTLKQSESKQRASVLADDSIEVELKRPSERQTGMMQKEGGELLNTSDQQPREQVTIDLSDEGGDDQLQVPGIRPAARTQRNDHYSSRLGQESEDDNDIQEVEDTVEAELPFIQARTENFQEASPACIKKMKFVIAFIALAVLIAILFVAPMPLTHVECVQDTIQDSLQSHYNYFQNNPSQRNALLIIFGALTDFLLVVFLLQWVHYGGSWRFVLSLCLTYALRLMLCKLFYMRQPEGGDLWIYPGWYSLTVQYGNSNDYYFNPVLAICTQLFFEYRQLDQGFFKWLCLVALVGDFYLSLCLKGHYLIDNYGGIVMGYQIWSMTNNWLCYYIDVRLFGLTLHERFNRGKGIQTSCQKCCAPINEWVQQAYSRSENVQAADSGPAFDKKSPAAPTSRSARPN